MEHLKLENCTLLQLKNKVSYTLDDEQREETILLFGETYDVIGICMAHGVLDKGLPSEFAIIERIAIEYLYYRIKSTGVVKRIRSNAEGYVQGNDRVNRLYFSFTFSVSPDDAAVIGCAQVIAGTIHVAGRQAGDIELLGYTVMASFKDGK